MDHPRDHRLYWKCRRGLLELDIVLQRYLAQHPDDASLSPLLDLPDPELWDIVTGRSDYYDRRFEATVARLRAA